LIVTHLTTIVFLYQKHHPEDGLITSRNMLVKILLKKCITQLQCICWLFIHFISLI